MRNEIVFDIETKAAPQGWGNREDLASLGISVVGAWFSASDQFRAFREADFKELAPLLKNADRIIGFAIKRFDIPVLQSYLDFDLAEVPALDIFEDVSAALGHRISLASLAKATLGAAKLGHGLDAVTWYREGKWAELEAYCLQDVRLTRDLYRFGAREGHLLFESYVDGKTVSVPVSWGLADEAEVRAILARAQAEGRAVEIDYVSRENNGGGFKKTRKIEIRSLQGNDIEAYDHLRGDVRKFRVGRVLNARILNELARPRPVVQSLFS